MSDVTQPISLSEELLYIYVTLKKLSSLNVSAKDQKLFLPNSSLFPKRFLLKQLNERLTILDELAGQICTDLFKQVNGQPTKFTTSHNQMPINIDSDSMRYPEFDEYFHFCLHQLYDFVVGLRWHEIDIEQLSKADSDYVEKNLNFVSYFFAFQRALIDLVMKSELRSPVKILSPVSIPSNDAKSPTKLEKRKSNLKSGGSPAQRSSPEARRHVRFKDVPMENHQGVFEKNRKHTGKSDLADNHSVLALDLLIYAINIYIQRLADTLIVWSNGVQAELNGLIETVFNSRTRIRVTQLQVIARKIKIYNDVHLTVLDHLSEIKRTYLIKNIRGALLSKDSNKLLHSYKNPRLKVYIQRIGLDVEAKVLSRLIKECLQIFFNLIICEVNADSFEASKPRLDNLDANKSQENILNFMTSWLKVDDVLFGYRMIRKPAELDARKPEISPVGASFEQTERPQLIAKTSTLSLNEAYKSSSRILSQMDNLAEFIREFLHMIVERLRYQQQVRYFLESISTGLMQFFDIVAPKLEKQLVEIQNRDRKTSPKIPSPKAPSSDQLIVKIRCLKFIHVIGLADRIIASEAIREKIELGNDMDMDLKLARLTQLCINPKLKRS